MITENVSTFLHHRGASMHQKSREGTQKKFVWEFPVPSALKISLCGLVVFIDMNMYILREGRNFKTFLKENYAIALDSKIILNMKLNMTLIIIM